MRLREQVENMDIELEAQAVVINDLLARLKVLECDHEYVPSTVSRVSHCGNMSSFYGAYVMKCSKCGKETNDLSEEEYLVARIEYDEHSFMGVSDEMRVRLAKLREDSK